MKRPLLCLLAVFLVYAGNTFSQTTPDRRPVLVVGSTIIDVAQQPAGKVWVVTRDMELFASTPGEPVWRKVPVEFTNMSGKLEVRQVSRLLFLSDEVALIIGDVRMYSSGRAVSVALRSTTGGSTWQPVVIAPDTLAVSDQLRLTQDGHAFLLDQAGRYWISGDKGASWTLVRLPSALQAEKVKELDMITSKMGVAIDATRSISFTTNGWQSTIPGKPSSRPIVRTQPHFLDQLAWARDLMMWNNHLILVEGRDIYKSATSDLRWERWDGVLNVAMSDDRKALFYLDDRYTLWRWITGEENPKAIAENVFPPRLMRAAHGKVVLYRPDTGPIVFGDGGSTAMRMYAATGEIRDPRRTVRDKSTEWGLDWQEPNDFVIDIYRRSLPNGAWQRDTFLYAGKTLLRLVGKDSLLFAEGSSANLYDAKARQFTRYSLSKPIESFLKAPVAHFRVLIERSTGEMTRRTWVDYRIRAGKFTSAELVDSSADGITSVPYTHEPQKDALQKLLAECNADGNKFPTAARFAIGPTEMERFRGMLDTIFRYDAYFDTLDLYRPPPSTDVQIASCKQDFLRYASEFHTLSDESLGKAMLALRHWPTDRDVRYVLEITNTAGDILVMEIDRTDEVHLPLLMPWSVSYRGQSWHWYNQSIAQFYLASFPSKSIPPILQRMMQPEWLLLAVASNKDAERTGRMHRWYERPWKR